MNSHSVRAIYAFELSRSRYWLLSAVAAPVISTALYFIVFGTAIGSHLGLVQGVSYGAFIVPGLIMLAVLTDTIVYAAFGIFTQKLSGAIYEVLSAPISPMGIVLGYVGAAATKSVIIGVLILGTARLFVDFTVIHPLWMTMFLILTAVTFSLFGLIIGIWADGWQKVQLIPVLVVTPLVFLGGTFYSVSQLPQPWRTIAFCNPAVYLISSFRWSFYGSSDVNVLASFSMAMTFFLLCLGVTWGLFRTGYKLRA